jgi:hypothetical protein
MRKSTVVGGHQPNHFDDGLALLRADALYATLH